MTFFLVPDMAPPLADFGTPPDGAVVINIRAKSAPFAGMRLTVAALEEAQRLHLRYLRWQDGQWRLNLTRAVLTDAVLTDAVLTRAVLTGADLTRAVLTDADLTRAVLTGADLTDAVLTGADLTDAVLTDADLTRAVLTGAVLTGADLTDADLTDAVLSPVRDDIYEILSHAPNEAAGLLAELRAGRIDGTTYSGACSCLVGTVARLQGCAVSSVPGIPQRSDRPAERWFLALRPGHTPENNPIAAITATWIEEWIAAHPVAS